jgi:hypothetical protein
MLKVWSFLQGFLLPEYTPWKRILATETPGAAHLKLSGRGLDLTKISGGFTLFRAIMTAKPPS